MTKEEKSDEKGLIEIKENLTDKRDTSKSVLKFEKTISVLAIISELTSSI